MEKPVVKPPTKKKSDSQQDIIITDDLLKAKLIGGENVITVK